MKVTRRVLLVLSLLLVVGPAGRAAVAAPQPQFITLVGSQTAYVDVRFDEKFRLDEGSTKLSYRADFAGWLIRRLGEPVDIDNGNITGAYAIREVGPPGSPPHVHPAGLRPYQDKPLAPGLYRVYLLADGPATVRIPIVSGAAPQTIRPLRPTTARVAATELEVTGGQVAARGNQLRPDAHRE